MKRSLLVLLLAVAMFSTAGCITILKKQDGKRGFERLKHSQLRFSPPRTKRVRLKNGMVLHMLPSNEVPLVQISGMVRIGGVNEPLNKRGLAGLAGSAWRAGGIIGMKPQELDEKLEYIGATLETSIGMKSGSISMSLLKRDLDMGLKLFADLIKKPAFDEKRFNVRKLSALEMLRRQNDEPTKIAEREFMRALFPNHPYGTPQTIKSVTGVTRDEAAVFYKNHVGAESFIIGISGDFEPADMVKRFNKLFADFPHAKKPLAKAPEFPKTYSAGNYMVNIKRPQSVVRMGHFGVRRGDADYYAVKVMNYILGGGGFASRLLQTIRSDKGLAYSVWSYFSADTGDSGVFMLGGETKTASAMEFIKTSKQIMREMIKDGITDDELSLAKEAIVNSFVFAFDKDAKIVSQYVRLDYFGLEDNYLQNFRKHISKVTIADVKRVAGIYLHPDNMVQMLVGDQKGMGKAIRQYGNYKKVKLIK